MYRKTTPCIGDVMKNNAPFLKLYADYVQNFDLAMETINTWMEKSPAFAFLLEALQVFHKLLSLWSPYEIGQTIIFSCCGLFLFFFFFFFLA